MGLDMQVRSMVEDIKMNGNRRMNKDISTPRLTRSSAVWGDRQEDHKLRRRLTRG